MTSVCLTAPLRSLEAQTYLSESDLLMLRKPALPSSCPHWLIATSTMLPKCTEIPWTPVLFSHITCDLLRHLLDSSSKRCPDAVTSLSPWPPAWSESPSFVTVAFALMSLPCPYWLFSTQLEDPFQTPDHIPPGCTPSNVSHFFRVKAKVLTTACKTYQNLSTSHRPATVFGLSSSTLATMAT